MKYRLISIVFLSCLLAPLAKGIEACPTELVKEYSVLLRQLCVQKYGTPGNFTDASRVTMYRRDGEECYAVCGSLPVTATSKEGDQR